MKEKLKETRLDLAKTMDELEKEKNYGQRGLKQLEAAAKEKLDLTKQLNEEAERATYVLNKLQDTY